MIRLWLALGHKAAADQGHQVRQEPGNLAVEAQYQRRGQGQPLAQLGYALSPDQGLAHGFQPLVELPLAVLGCGAEVAQQLGPGGLIEATFHLDAVKSLAAVGIEAIAATLGEPRDTLEDVYEPFLLQRGFLARTPRGRQITRKALAHLGKTPPSRDKGGRDPGQGELDL